VPLSYPRRAQEGGWGGIRVSSRNGRDSVVILRRKETEPGPSFYQEKVIVTLIVYKGGTEIVNKDYDAARYGPCRRSEDPQESDDVSWTCVGSLIALSVENGTNGSVVTAFSAGQMKPPPDLTPDWQQLGRWVFGQPLTLQGFIAKGDVLFAGPRVAYQLVEGLVSTPIQNVSLADLPGNQVFNPVPSGDAIFVDLSRLS
jgi:hypothetical protein